MNTAHNPSLSDMCNDSRCVNGLKRSSDGLGAVGVAGDLGFLLAKEIHGRERPSASRLRTRIEMNQALSLDCRMQPRESD